MHVTSFANTKIWRSAGGRRSKTRFSHGELQQLILCRQMQARWHEFVLTRHGLDGSGGFHETSKAELA